MTAYAVFFLSYFLVFLFLFFFSSFFSIFPPKCCRPLPHYDFIVSSQIESRTAGLCRSAPSTISKSTLSDCTTLLAEYLWSSGLLCCWPSNLEPSTGQPPWPGALQWQFQTPAENAPVYCVCNAYSGVKLWLCAKQMYDWHWHWH